MIFVLSIFKWPLKTGFTVHSIQRIGHTLIILKEKISRDKKICQTRLMDFSEENIMSPHPLNRFTSKLDQGHKNLSIYLGP